MHHCLRLSTLLFTLPVVLVTAIAADWPTYLHDNSRVGYTPQVLQTPLTPRWTYASPTPPQTSFSEYENKVLEGLELRKRVNYDDVFHVAIVGDRLYFGSSVDGRVYCRDLITGRDVWTFFSNGPIRLAPTVVDGKLYVGSDDGFAYCLDATNGKLLWKLRAGPHDERILARSRMTSRWAVRTGVLVDNGVAYFGAGIFPHETVYLYAVEAATGKVIWRNDAISQSDAERNDLSPQGYLLATKDVLFVPSGRTLAAAFDRNTGDPLHKGKASWRGDGGGQVGGSQAMLADGQLYSVGEHHILAFDQAKGKTGFGWLKGRQMTLAGDMGYMADGKVITAIDRVRHAEASRARHKLDLAIDKLQQDVKRHPALKEVNLVRAAQAKLDESRKRLKTLADAGQQATPEYKSAEAAVKKNENALETVGRKYEASRLDYKSKQDSVKSMKAQVAELMKVGVKWTVSSPHESAMILAGNSLIVGGKDGVAVIDTEAGRQVWTADVEGEARGLAAANGHLVVSTTTGKICVFADATRGSLPKVAPAPPAFSKSSPYPEDRLSALYATAAEAILKQTGIKQGFCLVLGSERGQLAYELARRSDLVVYAVDPDERKVRAARETLIRTSLYGPRLTVDHLDLSTIPYSSYFANLIVSDSLLLTGQVPGNPVEVARRLKPIGGKICLGVPDNATVEVKSKAAQSVPAWLAATKLASEGARLSSEGSWSQLTRGPLPGAGTWTHQYGNPGNTSSSEDFRVKDGLSVLWFGEPGPAKMVNRHIGAVGPVSVNGRFFIQGDESIMAYDAYNGVPLWERKNPGALRAGLNRGRESGNLAATDRSLFMVIEQACIELDALTGETRHTYPIPESGAETNRHWGFVAVQDGVLFGTVTDRKRLASERQRRGALVADAADKVFAYDVKTHQRLWTHSGKSISYVSMAVGDGRVFFVDSSLTPEQREALLAQDKTELKQLTGKARDFAEERMKNLDLRLAVALNARTGRKIWEKPVDVTDCSGIGEAAGSLSMMYHNNHLVLAGANANGHYWQQFLEGQFERRRLVVLNATTGEKAWAKDANYRHRPIIIGNEIIAEPWGFDLYTGAPKMRTHPLTGAQTPWKFIRPGHHCGAISAAPNMMFFRSMSTGFYNLEQDEGTEHFAGQRPGCWINSIPANGLLMVPEASAGCVCLFSIAATVVFEPRPDRSNWGIYTAEGPTQPVQHMALNLGAPGDRRDAHGKLWLGYPRPASRAGLDLALNLKPKFATNGSYFAHNEASFKVANTDTPWIFASGARGLLRADLPLLGKNQKPDTYTVRLYFAALEGDQRGQRVFDVKLQDRTVIEGLDVVAAAGGAMRALVREFKNIPVSGNLTLELVPQPPGLGKEQMPLLSAIEVLRTNAKEITEQVAAR